jgi:hypothetical protein
MTNEKRKAPRIAASALIHVCFLEGADETTGDGDILDLSATGMRFASDRLLTRGTPLTLKLHFPRPFERTPLTIRANVVRCWTPFAGQLRQIACSFDDPDEASVRKLMQFIDWLARTPANP